MGRVSGDDSRTARPRSYVVAGSWPRAHLSAHHGARVAQEMARRLAEAMSEAALSANRLSRDSGVNRQTIANVLAGRVWPDLLTIANLERSLQVDLWPGRNIVTGGEGIHGHPGAYLPTRGDTPS
jgi:ribosome-binding protein aMBF1 (putative translation factor)